jgi:hypothetical protein
MSKTLSVTRDAILSADFTRDMLVELAVAHCGYAANTANELADKTLSKPSKLMAGLDCQKLRTVLCQKLEQVAGFTDGKFTHTFVCLKADPEPDLDINAAGKNTGGAARSSKLSGAYYVAKKSTSASVSGGDEGKWAIWQHIWNCSSFEEYFAKCPPKSTKKSGTIISAASEMNYAVRTGMIVPGVKPEAK